MIRADVPLFVSKVMGGRPTRWATQENLAYGDYDGRAQTLEVFLADARDQLALLGAIDEVKWAEIEAAAGGPIVYLFHTAKESRARYADFLHEFTAASLRDPIYNYARSEDVEPPSEESAKPPDKGSVAIMTVGAGVGAVIAGPPGALVGGALGWTVDAIRRRL